MKKSTSKPVSEFPNKTLTENNVTGQSDRNMPLVTQNQWYRNAIQNFNLSTQDIETRIKRDLTKPTNRRKL